MAAQILNLLTTQMDKLVLVGMLVLIILSALQLAKMSRINRQLKFLTERLAAYLKAVLTDEEEWEYEDNEPQEAEFVSRQEQEMRDALQLKQQQKSIKDAQIFDAVLSEIFP